MIIDINENEGIDDNTKLNNCQVRLMFIYNLMFSKRSLRMRKK